MSSAAPLAFAAGALAALGLLQAVLGDGPGDRAPRVARSAVALFHSLARVGREGREPGAAERRRLLLAGAALAFVLGALISGAAAGLALGAGGPWAVARVLRARREHYRHAVDAGAAAMAVSLADALGAGRSLRGALAEAASGVPGPAGHELRRVSRELEAGARTEDALEAMRARVRSPRLDTIVAACLVQRRAGGDLSALLRETAEAFADQIRLEDEVRSATAQARFTGFVVCLLPLGGALLAELASPGFLAGLGTSFLTAWLMAIALVLQGVAAVMIRRLSKVRL